MKTLPEPDPMNNDLSTRIERRDFANPAALAQGLAQSVADDLHAALQARAQASLALSGGNTPKAFMQALAQQPLDWARVVVTLVDERWVPESHARSNAHLLRENLLRGQASAATFLPLYRATAEPEAALDGLERDLATSLPWPLDVAVLGMGEDGHTASFFPGGDQLAQALDPSGDTWVLPMRAPGAGEPRITLTLPALLQAGHLYLHVEGAAKRRVLDQAVSGTGEGRHFPIRSVLHHVASPVQTYWSA